MATAINNGIEVNTSALDIITKLAKRSIDKLIAKNPENDILTAPKTTGEFQVYQEATDAFIENKFRKHFKV